MQHLRNGELEQAQASSKPQVWHANQIADRRQPSASIQMAFLLPSEFIAPADQEVYSYFDESEYEEIVAKLTVVQQAIFDKPVKHRHLKNGSIHDQLGKRVADQNWADYESNEREYVW